VILNIFAWIICFIFLVACTILVYSIFRTNLTTINLGAFVFLWMFNTSLFMLLMGFLGLLEPLALLVASLVGLLIVFAIPGLRKTILASKLQLQEFLALCRWQWGKLPRWLKIFSAVFFLLSAIRFAFLIWVLPPFVWDSLTYHLTNVAEWTQKGRVFLVDAPVVRVALPSNYEVLATWFTVFLHHDVFVEAAGIPAYILAFLSVFALGRRYRLSIPASWIAAMAYISTPALILVTTGTKNDPQMAALFMLIVLLLTDFIRREDVTPERNFTGQVVLLIVVVFYALGTKIYLLHMLPGFLFIGIFEAVRIRQKGFWRRLLQRISTSWREKGPGTRLGLAAILSACVLIGLFWYVRNTLLFHNPFYPFGLKFGDDVILEAVHKSFPLGFERLPENIISFRQKFGDKLYKIIPALSDTTGWGWFVYVLGIPATLWAFVRRKNLRILMLGFLITLLAFFYSTRPSPFNMRYVIWFPAIFALGFAALYDSLPKAYRLERFAFAGLFMFCLALNLLLTVNYNRITIEQFARMLSTPVGDRDAAKLSVYVPEEYEEALDTVSNSELLGYNMFLDGLIYPLYRADYSQRIVYVPISEDDSCESVAERMRSAGTTWLFTSETMTDDSVRSKLRGCEEAGLLTSPRRGLYVLLEN
jgi:hypothetical protein